MAHYFVYLHVLTVSLGGFRKIKDLWPNSKNLNDPYKVKKHIATFLPLEG